MAKLSIIVPVYKVEKYLNNCIDSILAQTFEDFELILIDDGSPDRCGEICDEYAKKDSRIVVIHQNNKGVSAARNAGLDIAKGEYIGFVDSDDFISTEMYQKMVNVAEEKKVDVVICGIKHCDTNRSFLFEELTTEGKFSREQLLISLYRLPNPIGGCIWNKIVRFEKIRNIRYREGISMAEDRLYLFDYFRRCDNGYKIKDTLYWVVERNDSVTHVASVQKRYELLKSSRKLLKLAKEYSFELSCYATEKYLDDCIRNIPEIKRVGKYNKQSYLFKWLKSYILMFVTIIQAFYTKKLKKEKTHRFVLEGIQILRK